MTREEKRISDTKVLIGGDASKIEDATVLVYLRLAERKMMKRLYPFEGAVGELPEEYGMDLCELAARMYNRRGAEGETSHTENGVTRSYGSVDDEDILGRITPFIKVIQ